MAKFLYKSIPEYSKEILDILRDVRSDGENVIETRPLEEYLDNIDTLTFESIRKYIKNILTLNDIDTISQEYLPYLAYLLGHVWNPDLDTEYQRFILKSIIQLHKRKGTRFHIHYNLAYFDPKVQVGEPYKKIFILNKSELDSDKRFASRDYYSWGIYTVKSDYEQSTIREIVNITRPAGWRAIHEHVNTWQESFVPRVEDHYWDKLKETRWYSTAYIRSLHDYIMWGSLNIDNDVLLYEDPTGYFVRGTGKNINLPREFILNNINNVSSKKRIFVLTSLFMDMPKYGDTGVYVGPSVLYNSQFRLNELCSETLLWPKIEKTDTLFLGHSKSKTSSQNILLGTADRTDGGSLFKNLVNYGHEDWAKVGPIVCDVDWAFELGDRKWLSCDRDEIQYKNTASAYMGLKMILWSSTSAPFHNFDQPYDSYGPKYTFDQRDLDYNFFIHRAFSPKKYSRAIENNCRLATGLLPDDISISLTDYEDLPYSGTLVLNNEFIDYEKKIDRSQWLKFYSDGIEIKKSDYEVSKYNIEVVFNYGNNNHRLIIDKKHRAIIGFEYYFNGVKLNPSDYVVISRTREYLRFTNLATNEDISIQHDNPDYLKWRVIVSNNTLTTSIRLLDLIEKFSFYSQGTYFNVFLDKVRKNNYQVDIYADTDMVFNCLIDLDNSEFSVTKNRFDVLLGDLDTEINHGEYRFSFDYSLEHLKVANSQGDMLFDIVLGASQYVGQSKIRIDDIELKNLSLSALSDRIDASFSVDDNIKTIYCPADGAEAFQFFYYKNKTLLSKGVDYEVELLPRTIVLKDLELNKTFIFKYQLSPSIPIIKRHIMTLGWGNTESAGIVHKKKYKPRLLNRQDLIEYRYKLHKINNMQVTEIPFQFYVIYNYLGWDVIEEAQIVPEHNSVYQWDGNFWLLVSKLADFEAKRDSKYKISRYFDDVVDFHAFNPAILTPDDKVLVRDYFDGVKRNIVYRYTGANFVFHDFFENFERDKENEYGIVKVFDSLWEMEHYTGTDIEVGRHVVIKSPRVERLRKYIAQLHTNKNSVHSTLTAIIDINRFMGKEIAYPYVENIGRHMYSHILDRKRIKKKKDFISLNLGKKQPIGLTIAEATVLGGITHQYNMALNQSYVHYSSSDRKSIGAPITGVSGKSQPDEASKRIFSYIIGERKPLGNKLKIEAIIKETRRIELGNIILAPISSKVTADIFLIVKKIVAINPGIRLDTPGLNISDLLKMKLRSYGLDESNAFILGNKIHGKVGDKSITIGFVKDYGVSFENYQPVYTNKVRYKIGSAKTSFINYQLGTRVLLGN